MTTMPIIIVAELGVNWVGTEEQLAVMVKRAKEAGADAVKFQAFKKEHVIHLPQPLRGVVLACAIASDNVALIQDVCKEVDIPWFCTPFYPEAVDFLDGYVDRYKIREKDARALISPDGSASPVEPTELIKAVMDTKKDVYMSVQMKPIDMHWLYHPQIAWLYCKPSYPAALEDLELWKCSMGYGLSCHTPDPAVPAVAAALMGRWEGKKVIELHAMLDDPMFEPPDQAVSFTFPEFERVVRMVRAVERLTLWKELHG